MILYLHGFNSSPQSHKAQVMRKFLEARGLLDRFACPALSPHPEEAMRACEAAIATAGKAVCFVGSSLGGFYATWLAERYSARAVLLNPAIEPQMGLRAYLGSQKNLYTGESYELGEDDLRALHALSAPSITPSRYFLLVETGDEVLDYRRALERYAGARQIVVSGGDHTLRSFPRHLEAILEFCRSAL